MHFDSVATLKTALEQKKISSLELTQLYLNRIKKYDGAVKSFVTVTEASALAQAKAADDKRAKGDQSPLLGMPIAQKDIFCTDGVKTTCGSKMLDNFIAPYDATLVQKTNQAGIVMLGKTNMDEFAMGSSNETSFYGAVQNPFDIERVPGGSSGGSAAAVAAGFAPIATGTDTGGSIRQPASLCNLTGLKPTYGRVSRFGMIAFASSLDQAGPMGRTAEDCALLMNVISGFDERDSTSVNEPVPDFTANLNAPLKGLKIGLPKSFFSKDLNPELASLVHDAAKVLEKEGAILKEISLEKNALSVPVYYILASAECSSNLSRFDGVRYGHRTANPKDLLDLYCSSRSEGFGKEVQRRIMMGTYALSAGYYDAYYIKAQQVRRLIADDFKQAFSEVDVILGPTSPEVAFKRGEKSSDPITMYLSDIFTIAANLAGLPALSMPGGFMKNLPVGVQLIAPVFQEAKLLNVAHRYQQNTNWHTQTPKGFE